MLKAFPVTRLKSQLTPEEIESVYNEVTELLNISLDYSCFNENAARAESAFGHLLELLEAPPKVKARKPRETRSQMLGRIWKEPAKARRTRS